MSTIISKSLLVLEVRFLDVEVFDWPVHAKGSGQGELAWEVLTFGHTVRVMSQQLMTIDHVMLVNLVRG